MLQLMMGILLCLLFILPLMNICTIVHVKGEPVPVPKATQATSGSGSSFNSRIITVSPGEVLHLPCTLIRSGDGTVQWMKNGQPILLVSDCLLLLLYSLFFILSILHHLMRSMLPVC